MGIGFNVSPTIRLQDLQATFSFLACSSLSDRSSRINSVNKMSPGRVFRRQSVPGGVGISSRKRTSDKEWGTMVFKMRMATVLSLSSTHDLRRSSFSRRGEWSRGISPAPCMEEHPSRSRLLVTSLAFILVRNVSSNSSVKWTFIVPLIEPPMSMSLHKAAQSPNTRLISSLLRLAKRTLAGSTTNSSTWTKTSGGSLSIILTAAGFLERSEKTTMVKEKCITLERKRFCLACVGACVITQNLTL